MKSTKQPNRYERIILELFKRNYKPGARAVGFLREDIEGVAANLKITLPKNLGDAIYSFKYRAELPREIKETAPAGFEWIISGIGRARYEFRLVEPFDLSPRKNMVAIKLPDATPQIISANALGDEQALLAKLRYNRLIDIFLGVAASSLQNHLRSTVATIGQIEIDELYVGVDSDGCQYVIPVQAKGGSDRHGRQQTEQDIAFCRERFPALRCRPVSAQFTNSGKIAMFELAPSEGDIKLLREKHYELVAASEITEDDKMLYAATADIEL